MSRIEDIIEKATLLRQGAAAGEAKPAPAPGPASAPEPAPAASSSPGANRRVSYIRQNLVEVAEVPLPEIDAEVEPRGNWVRNLGVCFCLLLLLAAFVIPRFLPPSGGEAREKRVAGSSQSAARQPAAAAVAQMPAAANAPPPGTQATPTTPAPAAVAPAPAPPVVRLPASVPLNAVDPSYAAAHPGWQRYLAETMEFRVFREGDAIKAIQVISLPGKTLSRVFFGTFLGEVSFQVQAKEEREGYQVERGWSGDRVEVVAYRDKKGGDLRALVVAYR